MIHLRDKDREREGEIEIHAEGADLEGTNR